MVTKTLVLTDPCNMCSVEVHILTYAFIHPEFGDVEGRLCKAYEDEVNLWACAK